MFNWISKQGLWILTPFLIVFFSLQEPLLAKHEPDAKGWGRDGEYLKYYDASKYEAFKGMVLDIIDIIPLPGMAPGIGLLVRNKSGQTITVHLGPKAFVDTSVIELGKGDRVKCMGVWANIKGQPVFIASKVKKSEFGQMKLRRTRDGLPFWAMSVNEFAEFTAEAASEEEEFDVGESEAAPEPAPMPQKAKPGLEMHDKPY